MNAHVLRPAIVVLLLTLSTCAKRVSAPEPEAATPPVVVVAPTLAPEPTGPGLVIRVEPDDAEVIIDGASLGIVSKLELQNGMLVLKPGIYQVGFKRQGYLAWRAEVTVNDKPETILVTLKKP